MFLDCAACDFDFIQRTIVFVDWVRNREDARVHVLVTTRPAGGGGTEFNLNLIGRQESEGVQNEIRFMTDRTDTAQEVREHLTHTLELALAQYVAGTELGRRVQLTYEPEVAEAVGSTSLRDDPWHSWVFSVGLNGFLSGQESTQSASYIGSLGARHITDDWKVRVSATGSYTKDSFELTENENFVSTANSFLANALVVKSISDHWSAGLRGSGATSSFSNSKRRVRLAPAVEYSVFPVCSGVTPKSGSTSGKSRARLTVAPISRGFGRP